MLRSADAGRTPRDRAGRRARGGRAGKASVGGVDSRRRIDQLAHPGVGEVVEVLEDVDVPGGDGEMDVGHRGHRAADVVWRERQVVRLGQARQPAHPGEAAEMGQVGLDDVDVTALDERRRVPDRVDPLTGRDGRVGGAPDASQGLHALRRDRLLEPARVVRLEGGRDLGGGVGRETAVHLDHQVDIGSDRLPDGGHDSDRTPSIAGRQTHARRPERVELHRPIAARHHAPRQLRDPARLVIGLVPAVGIGRHAVAEAAPEQLPDRDAQLLAHEVEAGDVERGQRGLAVLARPAVLEALDRPRQRLGVERVGADHVATRQLLDGGHERVGLVDGPDLADAGQPGIGLELDEDQVAPRRPDDRGPDIRDLHATSSARRHDGSASRVRIPRGRRLEWRRADPDQRHRAVDPARRRRTQGHRAGTFRC